MEPDEQTIRRFMDASELDHDLALRLLNEHPELRSVKRLWGESILHYLAIEGFAKAVRFLAENGFDVNALNNYGDTALADVVSLNLAEVAEILLHHGANPNHLSDTDPPLLLKAIINGNAKLVDLLLSAGAKVDYDTEDGFWATPFEALSEPSPANSEILRVFIKHGITSDKG